MTKGTYKTDIRAYAKRLVEKIKETDEKRAKFVKENLGPVITKWLSYFDNATLYKGESMHENGTYVLCKYPEGDLKVGSQIDVFVLKDAVEEEKCVSGISVFYLYFRCFLGIRLILIDEL